MKQTTANTEAQRIDALLSFKKKGYNLKDTADPAVLSMELGNGYTLLASVKREWLISFDDGVQISEYQIDSVKIPFTNAKDANKLWKEYEKALKDAKIEGEPQESTAEVIPVETPNEAENVEPVSAEEADKLAQLDAIMNGEIEAPAEKQPPSKWKDGGAKALVKHQPDKQIVTQLVSKYNYTDNQIMAIKNTVAKGATDSEFEMLMYLADRYQLDPILKEIFYSPNLQTIMTSRDGYLKVAHRDPKFKGIQSMAVCENDDFDFDSVNCIISHKFGKGDRGKVIGAWAMVKKEGFDPIVAYAPYDEHVQQGSKAWKYKSAMCCKCAEAFALKRMFCINGLVTREEFGIESEDIIYADYQEVEG